MSVYVSKPYRKPGLAAWQYINICDMIADTEKELMEMAEILKINVFTIAIKNDVYYLSITPLQREQAADYSARLVDDEYFKAVFKRLQGQGEAGT